MNKSEQINELTTAMTKAQLQIKNAVKNKKNPHLKSKYADITSTIEAAKEALSNNGLSIFQGPDIIDGKNVLRTILSHTGGQWISSITPLITPRNDMQSLGTAITYARRYAYAAMVGIVTEEDDDGESIKSKSKSESNNSPQLNYKYLDPDYLQYVMEKKGYADPKSLSQEEIKGALDYYSRWKEINS
ncbi:MAG TPA: ERF family protein [Patescibacteria group bacterium]